MYQNRENQFCCADCGNYFSKAELHPYSEAEAYHDGTMLEVLLCDNCYNYRMHICYRCY